MPPIKRHDAILAELRGPDILHVGCVQHVPNLDDPRWMHGRIVKHFPDVWGIDIDEPNVAKLTGLGFRNLSVASAETFDLLPRRFDTIVAGELIEHLGNPLAFLERTRAHLKPGGRVVLSTPFPFSLLYGLYAFTNYPRTCFNPEHTLWMCPRTMTELANRAGLRVRDIRLVEDYMENGKGSRGYRAMVKFIRLFGWAMPERLTRNHIIAVLEAA